MLQKLIKHAVKYRDRIPRSLKPMFVKPLILMGRLTHHRRPLPDFLIIGAQKCGTTSLYNYLIQHPRVKAGYRKEVHFFDNPKHFRKGTKWYRAHFPIASKQRKGKENMITGEATPAYLCHQRVPKRVFETLPHAKLIVLLRNPVDRAISHYHHRVRHGTETLPFESAIKRDQEKFSSYLARGVYTDQLERWTDFFPIEQFLILKSEDLFRYPEETLSEVIRFLNLPAWSPDPNMFARYNSNRYANMKEKTKADLMNYFEPHNERLYRFLGEDLGWDA